MNKEEYLKSLIRETANTVNLLSNPRKWERECWVCQKFLESLEFNISDEDFIKPEKDPPDVIFKFKEANFEVMTILDDNRELHKEWKEKLEDYKNVKFINELLKPYTPADKIERANFVRIITNGPNDKESKYKKRNINISNIDLLIYFNLKNSFLDESAARKPINELHNKKWRSISIFDNQNSYVLKANEKAPTFLKNIAILS